MQLRMAVVTRQPCPMPTTPHVRLRHAISPSFRPHQLSSVVQSRRDMCGQVIRAVSNRDEAPWEVLGVDPDSSARDIKAAHRKLVLEHHPDRVLAATGSSSTEKKATVQKRFMRIQEAYEMLMGRRHVHMGASVEQDGWNFHDFFWSFNYHRRKKEGATRRPPPPAGSWKGQMDNLKRRAAARKWKKARQARDKQAGWFGNIMNVGGTAARADESEAGDPSGGPARAAGVRVDADGPLKGKVVSSQLEGLRRKAQLKRTILNDDVVDGVE